MKYDPRIHNRRSIRLKGHDYSWSGLYFLTVCIKDRLHLLGHVGRDNSEMILNDAGQMVQEWYLKLEGKYPNMRCRDYVVMPNHFHCIIEMVPMDKRRASPDAHEGTPPRGCPILGRPDRPQYGLHNNKYDASIFDIMGWFKTMTTNAYIRSVKTNGWKPFNGKLWQSRYHDHIIRNERSYINISNYIINNPAKWAEDRFNGEPSVDK